jgi:translation initiation factor 5
MEVQEVNIPTTVTDPHYRYKMPKIQTVLQGSGNGIKTKWINLPEVTNALKVPLEYPLKFIGKELGSNTEVKSNSYLINGNHTAETMQEKLDKFIKKYVLCPKCKFPEIYGKIKIKKGEIRCQCRSCGTVSKLDSTHEFASYIKRYPPEYEKDDKPSSNSTTKKEEKKLDATMKKNIRDSSLKIAKSIKNELDINENIKIINEILKKYNFPIDIKFYVFANGIFEKLLYTKSFEKRLPLIKHFIFNESDGNVDKALFFFLFGLNDFIFARNKGEGIKYLPSIMYYFYDREILSEEFWKNVLDKKEQTKYNSELYNSENEKKFINACEEFNNWIRNGPYEGEEIKNNENGNGNGNKQDENENKENENKENKEEKKEEEKKEEEKKEEEEINIDEI